VVALVIYGIVDKFCVFCFCCVVFSFVVVVVHFIVVFSLYCFAALLIGSSAITYVIFAALFVGF
jgi:hypothetical protein